MLKNKRALICGVTGQDGAYLARYLLVMRSGRRHMMLMLNFKILNVYNKVRLLIMTPEDFKSVFLLWLE